MGTTYPDPLASKNSHEILRQSFEDMNAENAVRPGYCDVVIAMTALLSVRFSNNHFCFGVRGKEYFSSHDRKATRKSEEIAWQRVEAEKKTAEGQIESESISN